MKKSIFVFLLLPLLASANFFKATITFNDGTSKNGFIELPEYADDAKIKFREEEKGKTEKYSITEVSAFEITTDKREVIKYTVLKLADQGTFNLKNIKPGNKKVWAKIIKEGKISLYAGYNSYNPANGTGGGGVYYIKRPNEEYGLYLSDFSGDGFSVCMNCYANLKKVLAGYFDETCSKFPELVTKENLKSKGIAYLVDLFEQNCGK